MVERPSYTRVVPGSSPGSRTKTYTKKMRQVRGFTLIELLVVIAIIGLLASIILLSFSGDRAKAHIAAGQAFVNSILSGIAESGFIAHFNEGSGSTITDWNGNVGVLNSGATFTTDTPSGTGSAVQLDGTNGSVSLPAQDAPNTSVGFTMGVWYKANTRTNSALGDIFIVTDGNIFMGIYQDFFGRLACRFNLVGQGGTPTEDKHTSYLITDGLWHQLTCSVNVTKQQYAIYVDGSEIQSGPFDLPDPLYQNSPSALVNVGYDGIGGQSAAGGIVDDPFYFATPLN